MAVEHGRAVILTDRVVDRNDWAKALVGRPAVHVASTVDDVLALVHGVIDTRRELQDQLRQLVTA